MTLPLFARPAMIAALMTFAPLSAQADGDAPCGVLVSVGGVSAALSRVCHMDEAYQIDAEVFTFALTREARGLLLEISPRNLVFLNGENEVIVPAPSAETKLAIFDSFSPDYEFEGENNTPVGYVSGWVMPQSD